jgi:hypothetical protein
MNDAESKREVAAMVYDLFKSSTIIQGTMAIGVTGTIGYLYIRSMNVPDTLISIVMLILGYYFGSKTQQRTNKDIEGYVTRYISGTNPRTDSTNRSGEEANP